MDTINAEHKSPWVLLPAHFSDPMSEEDCNFENITRVPVKTIAVDRRIFSLIYESRYPNKTFLRGGNFILLIDMPFGETYKRIKAPLNVEMKLDHDCDG